MLNFNKLGVQILINERKAYWDKQKKEYEDRYKETFLKDYERSREYLKKWKATCYPNKKNIFQILI